MKPLIAVCLLLVLPLLALAENCDPSSTECMAGQTSELSTRQQEIQDRLKRQEEIKRKARTAASSLGNPEYTRLQNLYVALAEPSMTKLMAKYQRNYYQALVAEGFTSAQALQIMTESGR